MYDPLSLEVWSITFPVGLQIQHAKDLTTLSPFPTAALTTAFDPTVLKSLFTGEAVLTGMAVLIDVAALGELCLTALISTYPDFVATVVGTKFLLGCG
ncbi:hypothetical protein Tco_0110357 [Tanacetum coccineum]